MTKFIDTDAGRQLLKEHFDGYFSRKIWEIVDPNFLEWQASWSEFPILEDIQKLFIEWKKLGMDKCYGSEFFEFQVTVLDYLEENQRKGDCGTYINFDEYLECNIGDIEGFQGYTDKYINELKSLVES